ncbi:MAG: LysM peptidoglycan-binding domain-containing protein [Bacteroidales bacterium]|nr:LysM peptidoglycan-binding domain-containing protein [Bacteroidales bacterium]
MYSPSKTLSKLLLLLLLLVAVPFSSSAQKNKPETKKVLKDSISVLLSKLDSMQRAYDEMVSAPFEEIAFTSDEDSIAADDDPNFNTDSALVAWYDNLIRHSQEDEDELMDVSDMKYTSDIPDSVYIARLNRINTSVKIPYNDVVRSYIIYYTQKMSRAKISKIVGLSSYYLPIFEEIFDQYGLPPELAKVSVIESALNPMAVSRARAAGMWQFMRSTGTQYGLEIDEYVDERFDYIEETHAAAKYLRDAYAIFGDWSLAIASYNCGPGNVNKAIKRAGGGRDFWDVYRYLPRETRGYVPAFIAAMYTMAYYKLHDIVPSHIDTPPQVDTFHVNNNLHFGQISECIGISVDMLRNLNPEYVKDIVPGKTKTRVIKLPYSFSGAFIDVQDTIYAYKDSIFFDPVRVKDVGVVRNTRTSSGAPTYTVYTVKRGDSLGKIASRHHTTIANIKKWNGLRRETIVPGQRLKIYSGKGPSSSSVASSGSAKSSQPATSTKGGYVTYTVRKGDTLYSIANKFPGVSLNDIMRLNGLTRKSKIYTGQKLKIKKQ